MITFSGTGRGSKAGKDIYSIQAEAFGVKDGNEYSHDIGTIGYNSYLITGNIAAFVARRLMSGNLAPGVFYFEALFSLEDLTSLGICPKIETSVRV